ncbi:MAG: DNA mismatch repair protein MutS [Acidobacteriota bacterium]|nr:DNA mismatch repair protein MutS [Acidobacteriota bacterium]
MSDSSTPLMRQHAAIKKEHPTALLFFRVGDFYELFMDDAVIASRELQITLTSRQKVDGIPLPMCGVPYHAAEGYIARLVRKGYKVAICDQMEDPKLTKKLVRREVTRVVTPGTAADSQLATEENNFLCALTRHGDTLGFAALDLSTGEFRTTDFTGPDADRRAADELQTIRPRELLFPASLPLFGEAQPDLASNNAPVSPVTPRMASIELAPFARWSETPLEDWIFAADYAIPQLENHFGVLSLDGFGLAGHAAAACAAGAILHYVRQTQRGSLDHLDRIGYYERRNCLILDAVTVRNLELLEPLFAGSADAVTLFRALDHTLTPMGKRLLRAWMLRPSIDVAEINLRLDAVGSALASLIHREDLRRSLEGILDIERLLSRITLETANPRDLLALAASLAKLPAVKQSLAHFPAARFAQLTELLDELADVRERIDRSILPEPPITLNDGGVIAAGVDRELDELRDISRNGKSYIAQIEQRERERTGINSLKVKFNNVFGFYIEISKSNLHAAPADYERKQTLVGAERFTTPELKEYEAKVLAAEEKIVAIERRLFAELRAAIAAESRRIRQSALAVAEIDVLLSFAHLAALRNYCRPEFDEDAQILEIVEGRHPVIEQPELTGSNDRFVPNDLYLDATRQSTLLITGPNMGGKSTYLRQTALIVLMAQMGCYVPATRARLSTVDRIFTRIGASDNLARGRSTFMVEMTETAAILNTATRRSLILLDEIGRGTATYDGLAIAWAVVEFIHQHSRAKTLFATHYHELTDLEELLDSVKNYHVSVKETGGNVVFLRKVEPGAADKSYGIEVAKLAGLPQEVILRARQVLHQHENAEHQATTQLSPAKEKSGPVQLTIFTPVSNTVLDRLREADLDALSPREALNLLYELKKQVE